MTMKGSALAVLTLLAAILSGCVIGGGLNYHFPNKPPAPEQKSCNPADKSSDCAPASNRAKP
jgi:hypothetical protein